MSPPARPCVVCGVGCGSLALLLWPARRVVSRWPWCLFPFAIAYLRFYGSLINSGYSYGSLDKVLRRAEGVAVAAANLTQRPTPDPKSQ